MTYITKPLFVLRFCMATNDYKEQRKQEYLSGTRSWDSSLTNDDYDRFTKEYVVPLRQLNSESVFGSFDEVQHAISGDEVRTVDVSVS